MIKIVLIFFLIVIDISAADEPFIIGNRIIFPDSNTEVKIQIDRIYFQDPNRPKNINKPVRFKICFS